jgi:hypothetical protein
MFEVQSLPTQDEGDHDMATNSPVGNVVNDQPAVTMTADVTSLVAGNGNTALDAHVQAINELLAKLKLVTREAEEYQLAIGQHVMAIKAAEPNGWEAIVKARCGLSRSRAYELMAIADGTKSTEQTRRETNARQIKYRQNRPVRYVTDKKEPAAIDTQIAELQAAHARQIDRYKLALARLSDAEALSHDRAVLRGVLDQIERLLTEVRGLTGHFMHNRGGIVAKINRAHALASSALHPGKNAGLPVKRAA